MSFRDARTDITLGIVLDHPRTVRGRIEPPPVNAALRQPDQVTPLECDEHGEFVVGGVERGPMTIVVDGDHACHTEWLTI